VEKTKSGENETYPAITGRVIEGPMAMAMLGGLVTSTLLNRLVLPGLALRFGRFQKANRNT
jgi:Cu/Ag efflux pump CusA